MFWWRVTLAQDLKLAVNCTSSSNSRSSSSVLALSPEECLQRRLLYQVEQNQGYQLLVASDPLIPSSVT